MTPPVHWAKGFFGHGGGIFEVCPLPTLLPALRRPPPRPDNDRLGARKSVLPRSRRATSVAGSSRLTVKPAMRCSTATATGSPPLQFGDARTAVWCTLCTVCRYPCWTLSLWSTDQLNSPWGLTSLLSFIFVSYGSGHTCWVLERL